MKKIKIYIVFLFAATLFTVSCSKEDLSSQSVIKEPNIEMNSFDIWLNSNYVTPYNIMFKYRMEDIESNMDYTLVPARLDKAKQLSIILKHLCLEPYDEIAGRYFIPSYFPKILHLIGSPGVNPNGTILMGTAEGGLKITLYDINSMDPTNVEALNESYFHTIHHEFAHILHQTKSFSPDFKEISSNNYTGENWSNSDNSDYLQKGFISQYSSKEANEDFVELIAFYILNNQQWWDNIYKKAGDKGTSILKQKLDIVKAYMFESWNIDLDQMRKIIERRSSEVKNLNFEIK